MDSVPPFPQNHFARDACVLATNLVFEKGPTAEPKTYAGFRMVGVSAGRKLDKWEGITAAGSRRSCPVVVGVFDEFAGRLTLESIR